MRYLFGPGYEERLQGLPRDPPAAGVRLRRHAGAAGRAAGASPQPAPRRGACCATLASRYPVVIISGRMRADVERRFANVPLAGVTGNHGLEPWGEDPDLERLVAGWRDVLQRELARLPGIIIEDKRLSITVDYRHAPDLEMTAAAIHAVTHQLPRARLLGGRHADFNIAPADTVAQGHGAPAVSRAVRRETRRFTWATTARTKMCSGWICRGCSACASGRAGPLARPSSSAIRRKSIDCCRRSWRSQQ